MYNLFKFNVSDSLSLLCSLVTFDSVAETNMFFSFSLSISISISIVFLLLLFSLILLLFFFWVRIYMRMKWVFLPIFIFSSLLNYISQDYYCWSNLGECNWFRILNWIPVPWRLDGRAHQVRHPKWIHDFHPHRIAIFCIVRRRTVVLVMRQVLCVHPIHFWLAT